MVARVGELSALQNCLRNISQTVLTRGGVIRNFDNLGDRVLVK